MIRILLVDDKATVLLGLRLRLDLEEDFEVVGEASTADEAVIKTLIRKTTLDPDAYSVTYVTLIPQCSNVQFSLDALPPQSKLVSISFDLIENDAVRRHQINAKLLCWAGNLLNDAGDAIVSDDD